MIDKTALDLIYLVSCALNRRIPDPQRAAAMDMDAVYDLASRHLLSAAVGYAMENAGLGDSRSDRAIAGAVRKAALFEQAWNRIKGEFEASGIWYMPLKGALLKDLYPRYGMREYTDYDILVDASRARDVREIMVNLGYEMDPGGESTEDHYVRPPVLSFEMHRSLFEGENYGMREDSLRTYYADIRPRLIPAGGLEYRFAPDDAYLYMIAHEYKHFSSSGTGLRSLTDTWVYLQKVGIREDYVEAKTAKLGLTDFERKNRSLALSLFGTGEPSGPDSAPAGAGLSASDSAPAGAGLSAPDSALESGLTEGSLADSDLSLLETILSTGNFGSFGHLVESQIARTGRLRYFLTRVMPTDAKVKEQYPVLRKAPVLYPFIWIWRILKELVVHPRRFVIRLKSVLGLKL